MNRNRVMGRVAMVALALAMVGQGTARGQSFVDSINSAGVLRTVTLDGNPFDTTNPFFQSLGTNGRRCVTCHLPTAAWSITPLDVQLRFLLTAGLDPIFRTNDGSNSPLADVSTFAKRQQAYSMLLTKGVIRVGMPIPAGAQFTLAAVDDPWGYASAGQLSLFRRPLPSTNLRFLTGVMWDTRESSTQTGTLPINSPTPSLPIQPQLDQDAANLNSDLQHQGQDATLGHAQAMLPGLTSDQLKQIVAFETNLATAQNLTYAAGSLTSAGAQGGPANLANQAFYVSINDSAGGDVFGNPFNSKSMTLFDSWATSSIASRASVARGALVFETFTLNAAGANCTTCHGVPNVGNRSLNRTVNLGISDPAQRYSGLPLYTLQNTATGATIQTTDPGIALVTGQWADVGKFKVPALRGLAARAPYFHNGTADTLDEVLDFYQGHFAITFSAQQRSDLIAFLQSL